MTHKLVRLEIQGFRNFQDKFILNLRSSDGTPLNYLVLNGPDKTSILDAISLIFSGEESPDINSKTCLTAETEGVASKCIFKEERKMGPAELINFPVKYLSTTRAMPSQNLCQLDPILAHKWLGRLNTYWREIRDDGTHIEIDRVGNTAWDFFIYKRDALLYPVASLSLEEQAVLGLAVPLVHTRYEELLLIDCPSWSDREERAIRRLAPKAQIIVASKR